MEVFTAIAFLAMVWKDSKQTRFIFFISYCTYIFVINSVELYLRKYPSEEESVSKHAYFQKWCEENIEDYDYDGMSDCEAKFEARMLRDELIFIGV